VTPGQVVVGDFTGNGRQDLAVLSSSGDTLSVLLNNGPGFASANRVLVSLSATASSLTVADFNGVQRRRPGRPRHLV
jgi:hypothetical protein